jgi:hypothetical protein
MWSLLPPDLEARLTVLAKTNSNFPNPVHWGMTPSQETVKYGLVNENNCVVTVASSGIAD